MWINNSNTKEQKCDINSIETKTEINENKSDLVIIINNNTQEFSINGIDSIQHIWFGLDDSCFWSSGIVKIDEKYLEFQ